MNQAKTKRVIWCSSSEQKSLVQGSYEPHQQHVWGLLKKRGTNQFSYLCHALSPLEGFYFGRNVIILPSAPHDRRHWAACSSGSLLCSCFLPPDTTPLRLRPSKSLLARQPVQSADSVPKTSLLDLLCAAWNGWSNPSQGSQKARGQTVKINPSSWHSPDRLIWGQAVWKASWETLWVNVSHNRSVFADYLNITQES